MVKSILFLACFMCMVGSDAQTLRDPLLKPYGKNPAYWQYKGKPVLLLGATGNDNLFQSRNVEGHLDSLRDAGGNYIRNTMSDRDPGDLKAFFREADGRYDLNKWNEEYWRRFAELLRLTAERDIIVQIEIWDRFDHSRNEWQTDPYNPKNNINYGYDESGLDSLYPLHPGQNKQPFFYSVPAMQNNQVILKYQQAFVQKLLAHTLRYDHVLYCIDNETSGEEAWAVYWTDYVKQQAKGKVIHITEMWDKWDVKSEMHKRTLDHPQRYNYIDLSQNSQIPGYENWENQQYVFDYIKADPRPVNSTKIYGSDSGPWLNRGITSEHAIQTFFRNMLGGFASSRFHRPPSGLGLSSPSINSIKTMRKIEEHAKMWEVKPRMDLLIAVEKNAAYLAAAEGKKYVLYLTKGGSAKLDLSKYPRKFTLKWITIKDSTWSKPASIKGGEVITLVAPEPEGCIAVLYE